MGGDLSLKVSLLASNLTGPAFSGFGSSLRSLPGPIKLVVAGLAALAKTLVSDVQQAEAYQTAMTQLQNTTGSSNAQMQQYAQTIQQLSDQTGVTQTNLAAGMYQIISANFAGADATRILTTATQAAVIAGANQTQVTTGLVVTLNAFKLKASEVDVVSNQMFKTLALGRGNMGDLSSALSTGAALVSHYGVSVTDMDATLATLSTGGMKTFGTSMTGLTQLLNVMDGKTSLIATRLHALGVNFDATKFSTMSYTQQIAYLTEAFKGHEKQMVSVLGSKQAATALGILGSQSQLLTTNIKKLSDTQELAKEKQAAWSIAQGDFSFQMTKLGTNVQNLGIHLGMQLLPWLTKAANFVTSNLIPALKTLSTGLMNNRGIILGVAAALTAFFVPALIKSGVQAVINGVKITAQFVASIVKAGIAGWQAAGKLAVMVVQFIAAGVKAIWAGIQIAASFVASIIKAGISAVISAGQFVASLIPAILSVVADAILAAATAIPGLIAGFVAATIAAWAFTVALLANPITWIVVGIIALIVAIVLLATHWKQVTSAVGAAMSWLGSHVHAIVNGIGAIFSWLGTKVHDIFAGIGAWFSWLGTQAHDKVEQVITFFQSLPGRIGAFFEQLAINVAVKLIELKTKVQTKVQDVITTIVNFFKSLPGKALTWGEDLIKNLISGIGNMLGGLKNAVGNVASTIANFLHFSKPELGPLAQADHFMPDMMNLMQQGIIAGNPKLQAAVTTTARVIAGGLSAPVPPARYGQPPQSSSSASYSAGSTTHNGDIVIHAAPGMNIQQLVDEIEKRQNKKMNRNGVLRQMAQGIRNS